jgi:hypothetical protein
VLRFYVSAIEAIHSIEAYYELNPAAPRHVSRQDNRLRVELPRICDRAFVTLRTGDTLTAMIQFRMTIMSGAGCELTSCSTSGKACFVLTR